MKISEQWLREWVDPPVDLETLASQLTTAGLEVDNTRPVIDKAVDGILVAKVLEIRPHPDASRLKICMVDVGNVGIKKVVCGAPNVECGLTVAFAGEGATVVGEKKIKANKIRGILSEGMLCSEAELGLGESDDGLLELSSDGVPGQVLADYLGLADHTVEVDLTPNRGDCLSHIGIAREVSVINEIEMSPVNVPAITATIQDTLPISLHCDNVCSRYAGRVVRGINPNSKTPVWMRERLRRCGVRPISPVVDVTNYVMLELGQPLHGFDLDKLRQGIVVRMAHKGEHLVLLDGRDLILDENSLVIADYEEAVALAGIMGGVHSAVSDDTTNVFFESAYFDPRHVARDARRHGLHTDASHRFERGVDPANQVRAVERATQLLLEIANGKPGPVTDVMSKNHIATPTTVILRRSRLERVLGTQFDGGEIVGIFRRLLMKIRENGNGWIVEVPSFRSDVSIEADLIEEVARIHGYDRLPARTKSGDRRVRFDAEARVPISEIRTTLVSRGFREAITYSFVQKGLQASFHHGEQLLLTNPISSDMSAMRSSLWPGLLQVAVYNLNRQQSSIRLFETGKVFITENGKLSQPTRVGALVAGRLFPRQWGQTDRLVDFFDLKADVEDLIKLGGASGWEFVPDTCVGLQQGQTARIDKDGCPVGWVGSLDPALLQELKVETPVFLFELDLDQLMAGTVASFRLLSKYPAIRRDLSIVVSEEVSAQSVKDCVGQQRIDVLKKLELFDVYRGEGVDVGEKSFTLSLTFQSSARTLKDQEIELFIADILDALEGDLGSRQRG